MDALSLVVRMAEDNAWANLRLHRACAALDPEAFKAPRTSFFPSLPATLNHILIVDWYYLDALERGGKGRSVFDDEIPFPRQEALFAAQRASDDRLIAFARRLDEAGLEATVELSRKDHVAVERAGDVLLHLYVHQIHHRGQAHAMLSGTDVKPPPLDEFFLREDLALREAELRALGLPAR